MGSKSSHGFQKQPLMDCNLSLVLGLGKFALDLVVSWAGWDGCEIVGWVGGDGGRGAVGAVWDRACSDGPNADCSASIGAWWDDLRWDNPGALGASWLGPCWEGFSMQDFLLWPSLW